MTERTLTWLKANFQSRDPQDWMDDLMDSVPSLTGSPQLLLATVTFETTTFTLGTVPANSIILDRYVARTTEWDAITTFEVGKAGDTDWLVTTTEANVDGAIPSGESQDVEVVSDAKAVDVATAIVVTLNHSTATQGAGYVALVYMEEVAAT